MAPAVCYNGATRRPMQEAPVLQTLLSAVDPHPAIGALFGLCFYLALPTGGHWRQVLFFTVASFGFGYSAGVSSYADGSQMLTSAAVSALSVSTLSAARGLIRERLADLISLFTNWRR